MRNCNANSFAGGFSSQCAHQLDDWYGKWYAWVWLSISFSTLGYTGDIRRKISIVGVQHTRFRYIVNEANFAIDRDWIQAMWSFRRTFQCRTVQWAQHGWFVVLHSFSATGTAGWFDQRCQRNYFHTRRRERTAATKSLDKIRISRVNRQQTVQRMRWRG